jgi:hypothetical protein
LQPNTTAHNKRANRRVEITLIKTSENEKSVEENMAIFSGDASIKSTKAANLFTYPNKKYRTARGYLY